jgi:RecA-family ATPase
MTDSNNRNKYELLSMTALTQQITPEWLIPDLLYEQQVGMMYAEPGSLKSFIALALASLLAHGMNWRDTKLDKGNVIYVAGEGAAMMKLRRQAWFMHHDIQIADDGLYVVPSPVDLTSTDDVLAFLETIKSIEDVKLVVFDTLSTCVAGQNESASEVMTSAIENAKAIARAMNCAVLFVHHPGKDLSRGARGHSSLLGNVDTMWQVHRDNGSMSATLKVVKQKDGEDGHSFCFTAHRINLGIHDRKSVERTSLCITESSPDEKKAMDEATLSADRLTIASLMQDGQTLSIRETAKLVHKALAIRERAACDRVKAAVPEEWIRVRMPNGFAGLRRVIVNKQNQKIEMHMMMRNAA